MRAPASAWFTTMRSRIPGLAPIDQLRRFVQRRIMRQLLRSSEQAILTVPSESFPGFLLK